jgi:hypothetical protein
MDIKNAAMGNWATTLTGVLAGILFYLNQAGMNIPTNKQELKTAAISIAIAWLGTLAKDANVGVKAK